MKLAYRPLNLQQPEINALEIVLDDYFKDHQFIGISRVGDEYLKKILEKLRRLK